MNLLKTEQIINSFFAQKEKISIFNKPPELEEAIQTIIHLLDTGQLRVAEKKENKWIVNEWLKKGILLFFKTQENFFSDGGFTHFFDKVPLKFSAYDSHTFTEAAIRVVPPACVRKGAYLAPNTVLMPSYVNIGSYIDSGTLIDTWSTVGSCAQIGKNVHLSGGVGIGGVLEPLQAQPTIIEDNCFIGARSEIVEGVIVEKNAVISMGVYLGQSTPIYNRQTEEIIYGRIPEGSVVIPGTLPSKDNKYSRYAAIIVKQVDAKTRQKTALNDLLRGEIEK